MQAILREMRLGWRDARWGVYFTRWFIPTGSVAILLACLIEGKVTTPPSSLTWGLGLLAAFGSYVWAGLRDGPDGYLGRFCWWLILLGGWSLLMRRTTSTPGKERIVTINIAGYSYVLSATAHPASHQEESVGSSTAWKDMQIHRLTSTTGQDRPLLTP